MKVQNVRLKLRFCANTFGSSPCTATGTPFCYNTAATCRDYVNIDLSDFNYFHLVHEDAPLMKNRSYLPCVTSLSIVPGTIDLTGGLGGASSVVVNCRDFNGDDAQDSATDPYYNQRATLTDSTWAIKFLQRYKYAKGQELAVITYDVDDDGNATVDSTDTYRIESVKKGKGSFTITASDYTPRLKEALIPSPSTLSLSAAVDASVTSFPLQTGEGASVSTNDYLRFQDEIVKATTITTDTLTVTRAQFGTTAAAHDDDTRGQICYTDYDELDVVWANLLEEAGIPSTLIDSAGAATEAQTLYDTSVKWLVVASVPMPARDYIKQLMQHALSYTFYEPRDAEYKLQLFRPVKSTETLETITAEANIAGLPDGPVPQEQLRVTRVVTFFGVNDWSKETTRFDIDKPNFLNVKAYIDLDKESSDQFGEDATGEVFAWSLVSSENIEVDAISWRRLSLQKFAPTTMRLSIMTTDFEDKSLRLGKVISLTCPELTDAEGAEVATNFIIVGFTPAPRGVGLVRLELYKLGYEGQWAVWASDTETDTTKYAQWCNDDGFLPDGSPGWSWV